MRNTASSTAAVLMPLSAAAAPVLSTLPPPKQPSTIETIERFIALESDTIRSGAYYHAAATICRDELKSLDEAVDYYNQRSDLTTEGSLKAILDHNRDDEMEHAAMLLEWLRREMPEFDLQLRKILFQPGSIVDLAKGESPIGGK